MLRPVAGGGWPLPAKTVAERLGIPTFQPERLAPGPELGASTVVVVAYGLIVPEELLGELSAPGSTCTLSASRAGVGRRPSSSVRIMAGDAETVVTIIRLAKELDAGPIAAQRTFAIEGDDDAGDVTRRRRVSQWISSTSRSRIPLPRFEHSAET